MKNFIFPYSFRILNYIKSTSHLSVRNLASPLLYLIQFESLIISWRYDLLKGNFLIAYYWYRETNNFMLIWNLVIIVN